MSDDGDYTIQIALLRELVGLPLEEGSAGGKSHWWTTWKKRSVRVERWVTVATGDLSRSPGTDNHWINSSAVDGNDSTPDPTNWCLLSSHLTPDRKTSKILWPPVPLAELTKKLRDPAFRREYMLPPLPRELK